jgi:1,4-alpha-glucan branching enzyme
MIRNFIPVVRHGYRMGVPHPGEYRELLNSDDSRYAGSGVVNTRPMQSTPGQWQACPHSITLTLPPLATVVLKGSRLLPVEEEHPVGSMVEVEAEAAKYACM